MVLINFLKGSLCNSAVSLLLKTKHYQATGPGWQARHFITFSPRSPGGPCKEKDKARHLKSHKGWCQESQISELFLTVWQSFNVTQINYLVSVSTYCIPIDARGSGLARMSMVSLQRMQCVKNVQWRVIFCPIISQIGLKLEHGEQSEPLVNKVLSYICPIAAWKTRGSWRSL